MAGLGCSNIAVGVTGVACNTTISGGTHDRVWLFNYSDISTYVMNTNGTIRSITAIASRPATWGYRFDTMDNATVGTLSLNAGTYSNSFQHAVTLRIFAKTLRAKAFVEGAMNGRLVAVIENMENGTTNGTTDIGINRFEVWGSKSGLLMNAIASTTELSDGIVYQLDLASGNAKEDRLPISMNYYTVNTTTATYDATLNYLNTITIAN